MFRVQQCSKHVEVYNKTYYKTRICALSWSIGKIYTEMHGQQNIKRKYQSQFLSQLSYNATGFDHKALIVRSLNYIKLKLQFQCGPKNI